MTLRISSEHPRRSVRANRTLLVLAASLVWPMVLQAEQDVTFSTDVRFSVKPSATGIFSRATDTISLFLYNVTLISENPELVTPRSFRVGVAYSRDPDTGEWDVSHWSPYVEINSSFDVSGTIEIKRVALEIPAVKIPLEGRWLVMQVRYNSHRLNGVLASSYAHSSKTVFNGQRY